MHPSLLERAEKRVGSAGTGAYVAVLSFVVLAVAGAIGLGLSAPWVFPSIGATLMLVFGSPRDPAARPLNAAVGHGVGIVAGLVCLYLFGMAGKPSAPDMGLTPGYLFAAALSVALTAFVLQWLKLPHPPAGATTLIVSLGIISGPFGVLTMAAALAFTIVLGWGINWLLGEPLPEPAEPGEPDQQGESHQR